MTENLKSVDELIQSFATSAGTVQQAYHSLEDELLKTNFPEQDENSEIDLSCQDTTIWEFRKNLIHVMDMLEQPVLVLNEKLECITWNNAGRVIFSIKKNYTNSSRIFQTTALNIMSKFLESQKESDKLKLHLKSPVMMSAECELRRHIDNFTKSILLTVTCIDDQLLESGTVRGKMRMQNLIGNLAHNIRTPISAIGGYAQLLQKDLGNDKKYIDRIQFINDGVQRIDRIIRNLIEYSHDPVLPEENAYNLVEFLINEIKKFESSLTDSNFGGVQCKWHSKEITCTLNKSAIRTIIKNILQNSLEALSEKNGKIKISIDLINGSINIKIEDRGSGMEKDILDKCREPFFTTRINGLGLGLSIVENMVMILGGEMNLQSGKKTGTITSLSFQQNINKEIN